MTTRPGMNDGRHFTSYLPNCQFNDNIQNLYSLKNNTEYREFLQTKGNIFMKDLQNNKCDDQLFCTTFDNLSKDSYDINKIMPNQEPQQLQYAPVSLTSQPKQELGKIPKPSLSSSSRSAPVPSTLRKGPSPSPLVRSSPSPSPPTILRKSPSPSPSTLRTQPSAPSPIY